MTKPLAPHRNYSNLEIVLMFVVLFSIVGLAYYVSDVSRGADDSYDSAAIVSSAEPVITVPVNNRIDINNGIYTSPGKTFSIRLADGWKLSRSAGYPDTLSARMNHSLTEVPGTPPYVSLTEQTNNQNDVLNIELRSDSETLPSIPGDEQANLATSTGAEIKKYEYRDPSSSDALYLEDVPVSSYTYVLSSGTKIFLLVTYSLQSGMTDHSGTVEKALRTAVIY